MPSISVIIPVYNVEKYLKECLDSIVNQTFADIEIICVNDGSTDSSLDILNGYAANDSRIRVLSQENRGLSGARNTGLKNATGKYVYFIDSDDFLELDALERLYDISQENDLDLVIFKLINIDEDTGEKFKSKYYEMAYLDEFAGKVFSYSDIPDYIYKIPVSIPGKFFRADLIGDMEFVEGMIFEDNPFFIESLFKAERAYYCSEYLYNRRVRQDSIITSNKNFTDYITVSNLLIDLTKKYGLYEQYKPQLFDKVLANTYTRFSQVKGKDKEMFFDEIRKDYSSKKEEYDNDEEFQNLDCRLKEIFYSALESQNAREYDLSIRCIDLERTISKREDEIELKDSKIRQIRSEKLHLISNSEKLSTKLNEYSYNNKELIKENKKYKQEIEDLKHVNSQLMSSTSWKVTKPIRLVGDKVKK